MEKLPFSHSWEVKSVISNMASFCLFPLHYTVQVVIITRILFSILGIFYTFFTFPHFSPSRWNTEDSLCFQSVFSPALSLEIFVDTVLLMGMWSGSKVCMIPWMVVNIIISCGLGATLLYLASPFLIYIQDQDNKNLDNERETFDEINTRINIILLNTI